MITTFVFYVLSAILVASATMVVTARNPVHAVLFLILAFFNAAGLFLIAGAEFLAMILVIVYVGAVAVLFLFVVMMLDVDFDQLRAGFQRYAPVGLAVGVVLLAELVMTMTGWRVAPHGMLRALAATPTPAGVTNTVSLGRVIYTDYIFLFQTAGLILLVAMMGAIVLTLREPRDVKRQNTSLQHRRRPEDTIRMLELPVGNSTDENGGFRRAAATTRAVPHSEIMHGDRG